jgi:hypothetical protein
MLRQGIGDRPFGGCPGGDGNPLAGKILETLDPAARRER